MPEPIRRKRKKDDCLKVPTSTDRTFLLKCCSVISASYSYHRRLLEPEAFIIKEEHGIKFPFYNESDPRGKSEAEGFRNLMQPLIDGSLKEIVYGAYYDKQRMNCSECLKYLFFYDEVVVSLPNATVVRINTHDDFTRDIQEILLRIRSICGFLREFEKPIFPGMLCYFRENKIKKLPKFQSYNFKQFLDKHKTLPVAVIPFAGNSGMMKVEFVSDNIVSSIETVTENVEAAVQHFDKSVESYEGMNLTIYTSSRTKTPERAPSESFLEVIENTPKASQFSQKSQTPILFRSAKKSTGVKRSKASKKSQSNESIKSSSSVDFAEKSQKTIKTSSIPETPILFTSMRSSANRKGSYRSQESRSNDSIESSSSLKSNKTDKEIDEVSTKSNSQEKSSVEDDENYESDYSAELGRDANEQYSNESHLSLSQEVIINANNSDKIQCESIVVKNVNTSLNSQNLLCYKTT